MGKNKEIIYDSVEDKTKLKKAVKKEWEKYEDGKQSAETTRQKIMDMARKANIDKQPETKYTKKGKETPAKRLKKWKKTLFLKKKMKQDKIPLTRKNYLELAYFGNPPDELSAEEEAELPEQFRKMSEENSDE